MEPEEAERIRAALLERRAALLEEGAAKVRVEGDEPVASAADEDEAPFREMDQSIASARNRERATTLARIDDALGRLAADPESYGLCEVCEEPIPLRRLLLMPFARRCVACQSGAEELPHQRGRKKVTDYK